jgi:exodeoxyribonuclease III
MNIQTSLFDDLYKKKLTIVDSNISLFAVTWNVANPSLERAKRQWEWLSGLGANIIILTEIRTSEGCCYLQNELESSGYKVFNETKGEDKYGVLVAIYGFECKKMQLEIDYLKSRVVGVSIETFLGDIAVVGLYVPSRGKKEIRNVEKRNFQAHISAFLKRANFQKAIIGGDFNVIPRNHNPHYPIFGEWEYQFYDDFINANLIDTYEHLNKEQPEYTWFSREGNGFRFDFLFISACSLECLNYSSHLHYPRENKLSDHSAVALKISTS